MNGGESYNDVFAPRAEVWVGLKLIDQVLLAKVIVNQKSLYHQDTYELLADLLGIDKVTRGMVQSSLTRLKDKGLVVSVFRGQFELESQELLQLIQESV